MLRYRMLFLNPKTMTAAAIGAFILLPVGLALSILAGEAALFPVVCTVLNLFLCAGLFWAWKKEDVIRVSGLVAGVLLVELCRYTYASERYLSLGVDTIVARGLVSCMMLSAYLIVCFVMLMVTYDHFTIFVGRNSGRTKMIVNQLSICVLLLCFLALTGQSWQLGGSLAGQAAGAVGCLADLCLIIMVACCELYLAVDGRALGRG